VWTLLSGCAALDGEPPVLEVRADAGGVLQIAAADARPGLGAITVDAAGTTRIVAPGTVDLTDLPDGVHEVVVVATDRSWRRNAATARVEVTLDRTPPELAVTATPAAQGRTFAVWVEADEPLAEASASFLGRAHRLYPVGERWRALVGVSLRADVGPAPLEVVARDPLGNASTRVLDVTVAETRFEEGGYIRLTPKQRAARKDTEAQAKMRAERDGAYATELPEQRWQGPLRSPLDVLEVTSPFGKYRTYSDGEKSYHTGVDLEGRRGTPVHASAAGRVLVAWEQPIHGNAVIVHHGQGVLTAYSHLDRIDVVAGQEVAAGDVVGTLGRTGQATGPHLHWTLIVDQEAVDPLQWLEDGFEGP
jgi:murein DD-endopeptidase MepM/ murein hydrolase activator NlpD